MRGYILQFFRKFPKLRKIDLNFKELIKEINKTINNGNKANNGTNELGNYI